MLVRSDYIVLLTYNKVFTSAYCFWGPFDGPRWNKIAVNYHTKLGRRLVDITRKANINMCTANTIEGVAPNTNASAWFTASGSSRTMLSLGICPLLEVHATHRQILRVI
jgi:hypothetical protein